MYSKPKVAFTKATSIGENSETETAAMLKKAAGIVQGARGELGFAEWNCCAGQNNVIIRTDGTVAPCIPM